MSTTKRMYEVWWSRGTGTHRGPRFTCLSDAMRFIECQQDHASFAIRKPDGGWYRTADGSRIITRRQAPERG